MAPHFMLAYDSPSNLAKSKKKSYNYQRSRKNKTRACARFGPSQKLSAVQPVLTVAVLVVAYSKPITHRSCAVSDLLPQESHRTKKLSNSLKKKKRVSNKKCENDVRTPSLRSTLPL